MCPVRAAIRFRFCLLAVTRMARWSSPRVTRLSGRCAASVPRTMLPITRLPVDVCAGGVVACRLTSYACGLMAMDRPGMPEAAGAIDLGGGRAGSRTKPGWRGGWGGEPLMPHSTLPRRPPPRQDVGPDVGCPPRAGHARLL